MTTAESLILISLYAPCSFPVDLAEDPPKEPIKTLLRGRFIALHIRIVRIVPAEPTKIPPVNITGLS